MKRDLLQAAAVIGMLVICLALAGCGESRSPFAGTYRSVEPYVGKNYLDLDLKENGKGTWTLEGKTVEFTWVVNNGRIWIYTKTGAIIIVTPGKGGKMLSADMSAQWHPGCPTSNCVTFRRVP